MPEETYRRLENQLKRSHDEAMGGSWVSAFP